MKIFLSAVTKQFEACRSELRSDLSAIGCEVKVQEDFQQGPRTLIERLEEYVGQCDRVIALVGNAYGCEAAGTAVPAVDPPRSYTQWEYFFTMGERLGGSRAPRKDLYLYVASDQFLREHPVEQPPEHAERQRRFREQVLTTGEHWAPFDSIDHLCRRVLRDGWQMTERPSASGADYEPASLAALRDAFATGAVPELSDQALQDILRYAPRTLDEYRLGRWAEWSQRDYALDKRFTRLTLLVDQGPDAQGVRWQAQPRSFDDLRDVLAEVSESAVVVLGPPGCGKSTLLRRLELDLAVDALRAPGDEAALSVFLELSRYRPLHVGEPLPSPREWLEHEWAERYPRLPRLDELLRSRRMVLLLDAVNEMPHGDAPDYQERIVLWRDFIADLPPGTRVVFSCRTLDYSGFLSTPGRPVPHVRIERLTDPQVEEFLTVYSPEQGPVLWRQLKSTVQLDLFRSPFYLKLLLAQARPGETLLQGRAALFTGFVRQTLFREISNPLLRAGALLDRRDRERIAHHEWRDRYDLPTRGALLPALSRLAFGLQERRGGAEVAQVRASYNDALALLGGAHAEDLLRAGVALQLLELQFEDAFFVHQLLQEYFAARVLAAAPQPTLGRTAWRATECSPTLAQVLEALADSDPLPPAPSTGWEETLALAAAMAPDPEAFVGALMEPNLPLAGHCAAQPDVGVSPQLRQRLQCDLVARSRDPAADLRGRIAAARALGELGDPRFERRRGPHGEYLLPPMVPIAAGVYPIGSDEGLYPDEAPAHAVPVAAFAIGQFPVTNAEWRCFLEAGGYDAERWWDTETARAWRRGEGTSEGPKQEWRAFRTQLQANPSQTREWLDAGRITSQQAEGWDSVATQSDPEFEALLEQWYPPGRQTRPARWDDPAFNHPAQPVVGICWHEARAYCAWLSVQTGQPFRLPSEAEWEAAARGGKGRRYAWKGDFDAGRCNTFETHVRGTTPPGVFPGGDTPEGLADMNGNVWEWTGSLYRPYEYNAGDGRENPEADGPRVVRGGSWYVDRDFARCAYRFRPRPDLRDGSLGFRVVRVSPIS